MKKYIVLLIITIGLIISTQATIIDIGTTIGSPANVTSELGRLTRQINLYNLTHDPDIPLVGDEWVGMQFLNGGISIQLNLNEFDGYLVFKWGNFDRFYYANNELNHIFYSDIYNKNGKPLGLSHYTMFENKCITPVPESSTAIVGVASLIILLFGKFTKRNHPLGQK